MTGGRWCVGLCVGFNVTVLRYEVVRVERRSGGEVTGRPPTPPVESGVGIGRTLDSGSCLPLTAGRIAVPISSPVDRARQIVTKVHASRSFIGLFRKLVHHCTAQNPIFSTRVTVTVSLVSLDLVVNDSSPGT